jgi:hypothetical protein
MSVLSHNWNNPSDTDLLTLAKVITKYLRFFDPAIVQAVASDNRARAKRWRARLEQRGVDLRLYLWEGSACCFPGVRRYRGAAEKDFFLNKENAPPQTFPDALDLDFNDYPKELCANLLGDRIEGIANYSLMHILSPSEINDQFWVEAEDSPLREKGIYGLFTNPGNTIYAPNSMINTISKNKKLRGVLAERQLRLYHVCNLVPEGVRIRTKRQERGAEWHIDRFEWAPCFGAEASLKRFLTYRRIKMERLFDRVRE